MARSRNAQPVYSTQSKNSISSFLDFIFQLQSSELPGDIATAKREKQWNANQNFGRFLRSSGFLLTNKLPETTIYLNSFATLEFSGMSHNALFGETLRDIFKMAAKETTVCPSNCWYLVALKQGWEIRHLRTVPAPS